MDKYQTAILKAYQLRQEVDSIKTKIGKHLILCSHPYKDDDEGFIPCLDEAYRVIRSSRPLIDSDSYIDDHCCPDCIKAHTEIQSRKKLRLSLGRAKAQLTKLGKELSKIKG